MESRTNDLLSIRPRLKNAHLNDSMSLEERFQNETLRPIIKLQNDLLLAVFRNYITKHKNVFYELSLQRQLDYIDTAIHKDMKFRNSLKGMIIGQFTEEEFAKYTQFSSSLNKRMMNIVKERLIGHIQLLAQRVA